MPEREPLTKNTVTEGSVVVLPAYPALFIVIGCAFLLQAGSRTSGHAFDTPKFLMAWTDAPMRAWGVLFLLVGVPELLVLLTGLLPNWLLLSAPHWQRRAFKYLLVVGTGMCGFWLGLLLYSALTDPFVSFIGATLFGFAAWCHVASIRSLTRDLVFKRPRSKP
jgi:hypothetical protein